MKRHTFSKLTRPPLAVFVFWLVAAPQLSIAVDCTPVDIALSIQSEADDFQLNHGPCDHVVGTLTIAGDQILDLDGLMSIGSVGGSVLVFASALNDITGLSLLQDIGETLTFSGSVALPNVEGLLQLESVGDSLTFIGAASLADLDGLEQLNSVGSLFFENNAALANVDGLAGLQTVGTSLTFEGNPLLTNLDGLVGLTSVPGDLTIWNNPSLVQADGLSMISVVGGNVEIFGNIFLEDLGLGSLAEVGGNFYMYSNHSLTSTGNPFPLLSVGGHFAIEQHSNLSNCLGLTRLLDQTDDSDVGPGPGKGGIPDVGGNITLEQNLVGCNSLAEIPAISRDGFEGPFNTISVLDNELFNTGLSSSIAVGDDGLPVIAYSRLDLVTQEFTLKVAKCLQPACTTANVTSILAATDFGGSASVAVGTDDLPIISYFDDNAGSLRVVSCNDVSCTGGDETISTVDDPSNLVGSDNSITIGLDDLPVISYRDQTDGQLKVAKCNDASCTGGDETISTVNDLTGSVGRFTSIAIGLDGFPIISYLRKASPFDSDLKVAKCNDPSCAGQDETISEIADAASVLVGATSIAVADDGLPAVAFVGLDGSIKMAKCDDIACTGGDESVLAIDPTAGRGSSLAIGSDGFPVLSYVGFPNAELKAAKCENADCSGNISRSVLDDEYGYESTAIGIGNDGLPIVSYHDNHELSLKVAHCESVACSPL